MGIDLPQRDSVFIGNLSKQKRGGGIVVPEISFDDPRCSVRIAVEASVWARVVRSDIDAGDAPARFSLKGIFSDVNFRPGYVGNEFIVDALSTLDSHIRQVDLLRAGDNFYFVSLSDLGEGLRDRPHLGWI